VARRAAALMRAADLMEERRGRLIHLLQVEAGKTLDDALSEVREAVDFARYYAVQAKGPF
jgi:RHH-type proline utilization regulon transcriptional repressor/proline dehydrogenase/delta 1-pyrroline-5-carboxylate dehydrogenase